MSSSYSDYISEIGWEITTADTEWYRGTDSRVTVEIIRDDDRILLLNVEPGHTSRLDRGDSAFHYWTFKGFFPVESEYVTYGAGIGFPRDGVEFPEDIQGHLKCKFRIHGDDLWTKDNIEGYVRYVRPKHIPGTIDSHVWVDDLNWTHVGTFSQDANLSTDRSEGYTTWTLLY